MPARADGCFVFKWDKKIDINEPTQKAIIVHDSGHEEMLLQVKYEGPLEEFGWLIPTPTLPKVEKGAMEPFYELSQLTQRRFGTPNGRGTRGTAYAAGEGHEAVKVIEIKTVGAYEVAVLSAQDSGSLTRWLKENDYSLPEGKTEIIDEYVRPGWYFIAAKIELNKGIGLKALSSSGAKNPQNKTSAREIIKSKLSNGELHPLLISFDTAKPVFPLKISAVGGRLSEISLYVIAKQPMLEKSIFGRGLIRAQREYTEWNQKWPEWQKRNETTFRVLRALNIATILDSFYTTNHSRLAPNVPRDYSNEDLQRIANEGMRARSSEDLARAFDSSPEEMLQCMALDSKEIPKCSREFARLKTGDWFLTKIVQIFAPAEMHDLEFEPAIAELEATLSQDVGGTAAQVLARLGDEGEIVLRRACGSSNVTERLNAVIALERERKRGFVESLHKLLGDKMPAVRLHAIYAAEAEPDERFIDTMVGLLRDPIYDVRLSASGYLASHERTNRMPVYLALLKDRDPNVRAVALGIMMRMNRHPLPHEMFVEACRLLKDPDEGVQEAALHTLYGMRDERAPRDDIVPFLSNPNRSISGTALSILRSGTQSGAFDETGGLTSAEAARLLSNSLTMSRLTGLKFLQYNADAKAIDLIVPLLTDGNMLVRNRAFVVLRRITGKTFADDAEKWKDWWSANKSSFVASRPGQKEQAKDLGKRRL